MTTPDPRPGGRPANTPTPWDGAILYFDALAESFATDEEFEAAVAHGDAQMASWERGLAILKARRSA